MDRLQEVIELDEQINKETNPKLILFYLNKRHSILPYVHPFPINGFAINFTSFKLVDNVFVIDTYF